MMMSQESDLRAEEGIPVEVKLLDNGGYYDAFLMDVFEDEALIHFPMNWIEETRLPFSLIRFPPDEDAKKVEIKENMVAEAYLHKQPGIYKGWFKCVVKVIKSAHCEMEYLEDHSGVDFVDKDMLRPFNDKPSLSWDMLHVHAVSIPEEIQEYASTVGVHNDLKIALKSALINYDSDNHELIIISSNETDISRAKIFEKAHLRSLTQKARVLHLSGNLIRPIKKAENGLFVEEFTISDNFIGRAIGKKQANLRVAKNIEGVSYVRFVRKSNKFIICGETEKAVRKARELLDIRMEYYFIPENEMSQMVGKNSKNILTIVEAAGVVEIFIPKSKDVPDNYIREGFLPLAIVGTSNAITGAKVFIDFQLDHINEVSNLRKKQMKVNQDINDYFKKSPTIGTDSRANVNVNDSEVVQLTAESASHAGVYSSEVQEISLQSQIEANQQIDNWEDVTSFQGEKPNVLNKTELQIRSCRDDSDTTEKNHLGTQRKTLKSSTFYEAQQISPIEEINKLHIESIPKVEDMHLEKIASNTAENVVHTTTILHTYQNTQVPQNEMQLPQSSMPIYSATVCNSHQQHPASLFLDLSVGPSPPTEISSMARTPINFENEIYSDTSCCGYTNCTHLPEIAYQHEGYNVTSITDQRQNLFITMLGSNAPSFASGDLQITGIDEPNSNPISSNSSSFASGGMQITKTEAPTSKPPSINYPRFASGNLQITEIEASSSNPPSFALGDRHFTEIKAPSSSTPSFASEEMQINLNKTPSSNSSSSAACNTQITLEKAPRTFP